ncbi:methyltransferase domain-containing protein [Saccharothrix isguenensis]
MRLASINLNKRLGNPVARTHLTRWLLHNQVDVLVAQEPWKPVARVAVDLPGFRHVDGNGNLFCWSAERYQVPRASRPADFAQRLELAWLVVYNAYLDSGSTTSRRDQLDILRKLVGTENRRPVLACGDFNLAPRLIDGVSNGHPSDFNSSTERERFAALLAEADMVDSTATDAPEFTIERRTATLHSRFRCDLALISDHLRPVTSVRYDHSVRSGTQAFTDHSAILVDLPVTLPPADEDEKDTLFSLLPEPDDRPEFARAEYHPHKTAMNRGRPSPFARSVVDTLVPNMEIGSIFDYGCGRGSDVDHYRSAGLTADGWDPHPGFGRATKPDGLYDLVTNIFVLNVLPNPWQRIEALQDAARFVRPGGFLLVVTRSPADIAPRATSANWPIHHDGYWSDQAKGTFQKGISTDEIIALGRQAGLRPASEQTLLTTSSTAGQALLVKPSE